MIRRLLLFLLALATFAGSVTAAVATRHHRNITLRGYVNPIETHELPYRVPRPGINADLSTLSDNDLIQLEESSVHWLRHEFALNTPWTVTDNLINREHELELVAVLPDDIDFIDTFSQRYSESIDVYQINLPREMSPASYSEFLRDAYVTIHSNDQQPTVIASITSDPAFLRQLYAYAPHFDAVGVEIDNTYDLVTVREVMTDHGDSHKAIWITPLNQSDTATTLATFNNIEREWAWVGAIIMDWDATISASFWENLPDSQVATTGVYPAQTPYAQYSGIWTIGNQGGDIGWVNDSRARFQFSGTDVALIVREGDYVTSLYPMIDGEKPNRVPQDVAGNPYILLTSDSLEQEARVIPVATGLNSSTHTMNIIADELIPDEVDPRWHLVGYAVGSGDLATPYNRQINIAWLTASITFFAVIVTGFGVLRTSSPLWDGLNNLINFGVSIPASIALMIGMLLTWNDATPQLFRRDSVQLGLSILTAGIIYLELGIIITIASALLLFVIIYNRIEYGLMLTILWAPFFLFPVELARFAFPIAEIVLWITVGAWGLKLMANYHKQQVDTRLSPRLPRQVHPLDYAMIVWVIIGGISLIWTEYRGLATTELRTLIIQPALFYVIFRTLHVDKHMLLRFVNILILAGFAVAGIGLIQFALGESIITAEEDARRLASVYGSPNNVGLFLGRCIPFALTMLLIYSDRSRRIFAGTALVVMFIAALLTQGSGTLFMGLPVAIAMVILLTYRRNAIMPLIILGIVGALGAVFALQLPRFSNLLDLTQGTDFYRLRVWDSALNIIGENPFTGIGLDQFLYAFRGEYIMPDAWEEPTLSHPHNVVLDFWTRLGILGVAWFISVQIIFWRSIKRNYIHIFRSKDIWLVLVIGSAGSMANLLAHGLIDNSVFVIDLAYIFVLLLANISAIDEIVEEVV